MLNYVTSMLRGQFEAALCMMHQCLQACPPEHWDGKIANGTFRWVTYHTLFFVDLYLSPSEEAFTLRDLHLRGGDEREPRLSPGLSKEETIAYLEICRQKLIESLAPQTFESLKAPCGFAWRSFSRGEMYIYNLRHVQHHTGQLSAYLRKVDQASSNHKALPWVGTGWRNG